MNLFEFQDSLLYFSKAISIEELTDLCRFHCRQLGFDHFIYALRVPTNYADSRLIFINGYPDGWVDHYFAESFNEFDPVLAYSSKHIMPIQWHDLTLSPSSPAERVMNEAGDFGLKTGITMPVHSPQGELGILSFTLNQNSKAAYEITEHAKPYLQLLSAHLHEAVRRVFALADYTGKHLLTKREQECLRWVADGKTTWEIAQLLNMSERTVNFHMNNAMQKLDVCNRQHAVAKAALQGLIQPYPF
jgi:DNA-binding CsgD family transcriptional regulator